MQPDLDTAVVVVPPVRRVMYTLLVLVVMALLVGFGVLALVLEDSGWPLVVSPLLFLLSLLVAWAVSTNLAQRWVVGAEKVTLLRPGRARQTWRRTEDASDISTSPLYARGIRIGTRRVLSLQTPIGVVRRDVSVLGPAGASALGSALRPRRRPTRGRGRPEDVTVVVDHAVIAQYRRRRLLSRLLAVAVGVGSFLALGATGHPVTLLVTAMAVVFLVASVGAQVLLRPVGPTPASVRASERGVVVELVDGERREHPVTDLVRIDLSADTTRDVDLVLAHRDGTETAYSLTARAGDGYRHRVLPELMELREAVHDVADAHDLQVVDLER